MKRALIIVAGAWLLLPGRAPAQIRASELGSVSQTIDGTRITVTGSRPRARNRDRLFGHVVHWGEVWTPGANFATTLETNRAIKLNGHAVAQGKYSMWIVVREHADWTLMLDTVTQRYHTNIPDSMKVHLRFPLKAQEGPFTEMLTWSFPEVRATGGTLAMHWGTTKLALDVAVEASLHADIAAAEAAAYVGRYTTARNDTVPHRGFTIMFANDTLKAEWDSTVVQDGQQSLLVGYMKRFALIRVAPDWFVPGLFDENGRIYEVLRPELVFQFTRTDDTVRSFELRNARDRVVAIGRRKD